MNTDAEIMFPLPLPTLRKIMHRNALAVIRSITGLHKVEPGDIDRETRYFQDPMVSDGSIMLTAQTELFELTIREGEKEMKVEIFISLDHNLTEDHVIVVLRKLEGFSEEIGIMTVRDLANALQVFAKTV